MPSLPARRAAQRFRGRSSAGRAPPLQGGRQEFESPRLHRAAPECALSTPPALYGTAIDGLPWAISAPDPPGAGHREESFSRNPSFRHTHDLFVRAPERVVHLNK